MDDEIDGSEEADSLAVQTAERLLSSSMVTGLSGLDYELVVAGHRGDSNVETSVVRRDSEGDNEAADTDGEYDAQVQVIVRRWREKPVVSAVASLGRRPGGSWERFRWPASEQADLEESEDDDEGMGAGCWLGCALAAAPWFVGAWYLLSKLF